MGGQYLTIKCEGCGKELHNYNSLTRKWDEVSTERPHVCPNPEKLRAALKARRLGNRMTNPNVEKYVSSLKECKKCHARYSIKIEKCPNCTEQFVKSLFVRDRR